MPSSFHLLSSRTLAKAKAYLRTAAAADDFQTIHSHFLEELPNLLPSEAPCWDIWSADRSTALDFICPPQLSRVLTPLTESINATIPTHPVVTSAGWISGEHSPALLSDYTSQRQLRELPLHREVYRHFDARYQIVADFGTLPDRFFIVSLNRGHQDFSREEFQLFDFIATGMDHIARGLDLKLKTVARLRKITTGLAASSGLDCWQNLTVREVETLGLLPHCPHLSELAAAQGVSRYTITERMTSIRDKLGLETTAQLRAVIRDLSPDAPKTPASDT